MTVRIFGILWMTLGSLLAQPLDLRLPTDNHHLFTGEFDKFYMYVDRNFEGAASKPWEAGSFGFVRNAARIQGEVILTKFHEGIDISPMRRDAAGNPLDLIGSISAGRVVYCSISASSSNYGKYVVVGHPWENSLVFSVYAHLAEISCKPGDEVAAGGVLGRMGYTGDGLNRTRAHLHLELGMLMSARYGDWHKLNVGSTNHHGLYNGMNICGTEVSRFFTERKANPNLTFSKFVTSTPVYFKVAVPINPGVPDFVKRYPWIAQGDLTASTACEIGFTATGLPVSFAPTSLSVTTSIITSVRPSKFPHRHLTRGLVTGEGNRATLTDGGKKLIALLTDDFPVTPTPPPP